MAVRSQIVGIDGPETLEGALRDALYLADDGLATSAYLALALGKPLLLEGAPGVGKTEAAKALTSVLGRQLIRLQCYEGIDASTALYEWNYPRQMLAIRQAGETEEIDIYHDKFLIERPMLAALRAPERATLLIDEIDRSDHEFEAFLLEFLSDFQISIPEPAIGALAGVAPVLLLPAALTWLLVLVLSGMVGLATMLAAISLPVYLLITGPVDELPLLLFCAALAVYVVFTHRSNIQRIRSGEESRMEGVMLLRRFR